MDLTDSPYKYFQLLIHFKFIAYRDRKDALNPFQCSHANLNLQGDEQYTPQLPWVMKVRLYGHLESEVFISFFSFFTSGHRDQIACSLLGVFSKPRTSDTQSLDYVPI